MSLTEAHKIITDVFLAVIIGNLIGKHVIVSYGKNQKWQLIFKQFANPRTIEYMDIRRIAYTMTLKCIVNRVA